MTMISYLTTTVENYDNIFIKKLKIYNFYNYLIKSYSNRRKLNDVKKALKGE